MHMATDLLLETEITKGIDKFYSLHLLKEEEMDLPTVRNNLDVE